jgi:hypothetical protein
VLCVGQNPGATVRGVTVAASVLHIAGFATPDDVLIFLESNVPQPLKDQDDAIGSGEMRLYAVGHFESESGKGAILLFSELADGAPGVTDSDTPLRWTLQLQLSEDAGGAWGITHLTARRLQLDSQLEPALVEPVVRIDDVEWRRWEE